MLPIRKYDLVKLDFISKGKRFEGFGEVVDLSDPFRYTVKLTGQLLGDRSVFPRFKTGQVIRVLRTEASKTYHGKYEEAEELEEERRLFGAETK